MASEKETYRLSVVNDFGLFVLKRFGPDQILAKYMENFAEAGCPEMEKNARPVINW